MKHFVLFFVIAFAILATASIQPASIQPSTIQSIESAERPVVNLPVELRQINWFGRKGQGSCAWASLVMSCNWANEIEKAKRIRATKGDGVNVKSLCRGMTSEGIPYALTYLDNDTGFLEQAIAGRRPVMVVVDWGDPNDNTTHMVLLTHIDEHSVCLVDNNSPREDLWMTREAFEREWDENGSIGIVNLWSAVPPLAHN